MKFLVFADLHHYPGVFYTQARERLAAIMQRAEKAQVDCAISLGDFCHSPSAFGDIIADFDAALVPVRHVLGNHDTDGASVKETLRLYHMQHEYYSFDLKNFRFIMLDTNYYRHSGGFTHFEYRNYFDFPESRETLPPEQIDWLEQTIRTSPYPCLLFSHASIERESKGGVSNRDAILAMIRRANSGSRKVLMALNGHHHRDALRIIDNVAFFDVNSASFDWLNQPHELYPESLRREFELINHQVIYTEPLSAIVTISGDNSIEIEGKKGDFLHGIRREMTNNSRCDNAGRPCTPEILSARFRLF
ncbi:MAG: metallophosphoesterase [Lentisphaeria bacterium]